MYCSVCGSELTRAYIEGRERQVCPACGTVHYAQLKVGAGVIARREDGQIVLVHRTRPPFAGTWCLPAGYVEADEDPADAAVRECREETGLEVVIDALFNVYYWDDDPRGNGILVVYLATVVGGELRGSEEGEPAFFAPDALPTPISGAGHQRALADWSHISLEAALEAAYRYCPKCAGRLQEREAFGRRRLVCNACGFILFRDPKLAAGALVVHEGRVLLAKRAINPEMGKWYVPAGYVEFDETPAEAAIREVREETGLEIALEGLLDLFDFGTPERGRGVLVVYRARVVGGTLQPGDDADAAAFFAPDELPEDIAFESSRQVLERWKKERRHGGGSS